jgi:uncharacterized protein (DUF1778 family)
MPKDSTPICFRVSDDDRIKLEAAASFVGESLSAFIRDAAMKLADAVMNDGGGVDVVIDRYYTARAEAQARRERLAAWEIS